MTYECESINSKGRTHNFGKNLLCTGNRYIYIDYIHIYLHITEYCNGLHATLRPVTISKHT